MAQVIFGDEATKKLLAGIVKLEKVVCSTLGPNGRNVLIKTKYGQPKITKDGITVAKAFKLSDPIENMGADLVKSVSADVANIVGDGTTTAVLLAASLFKQYVKDNPEFNVFEIKKYLDEFKTSIISFLETNKSVIENENDIYNIATISGNNDSKIGKIISEVASSVGYDGGTLITKSKSTRTYFEILDGYQLPAGYTSMYFVTDREKMRATLDEAYILITSMNLEPANLKSLLPLLEWVNQKNKGLLVVAPAIHEEIQGMFVINNNNGSLKNICVHAPGFGEFREAILEDLAIATGATVIDGKINTLDNPENLGFARKVQTDKENTIITEAVSADSKKINDRINEIKKIMKTTKKDLDHVRLQERIARLAGNVAVIYVGGESEIETEERKDLFDDALFSTKAAIKSGYLPGGGISLLRASAMLLTTTEEEPPAKLFARQLMSMSMVQPFLTLAANSGLTPEQIDSLINMVFHSSDFWEGKDFKNNLYDMELVNMKEAGIIEPKLLVEKILTNVISIVGTLLTTRHIVEEDMINPD